MPSFGKRRRRPIWPVVIIIICVIVFGGYWFWKASRSTTPKEETASLGTLPRMANLPPKKTKTKPPPPSYPPDAPLLEEARKALGEGITPAEAVAMANSLPDKAERADAAFLLLDYAAEEGNAVAALAVGRFYDPAYDGPSGSIQKDPAVAYEWYQEALAGGQEEAKTRLAALRRWVEQEATQGSGDAKDLLATWR